MTLSKWEDKDGNDDHGRGGSSSERRASLDRKEKESRAAGRNTDGKGSAAHLNAAISYSSAENHEMHAGIARGAGKDDKATAHDAASSHHEQAGNAYHAAATAYEAGKIGEGNARFKEGDIHAQAAHSSSDSAERTSRKSHTQEDA